MYVEGERRGKKTEKEKDSVDHILAPLSCQEEMTNCCFKMLEHVKTDDISETLYRLGMKKKMAFPQKLITNFLSGFASIRISCHPEKKFTALYFYSHVHY